MSDSTPGRGSNYQKDTSTRTRGTSTELENERYNYHHGAVTLHDTSRTQNYGTTEPNSTVRKPIDSSAQVLSGGTPTAEEGLKSRNALIKQKMTDRNDDEGGKSGMAIAEGEEAVYFAQKDRDIRDSMPSDDGIDISVDGSQDDEYSSISSGSSEGDAMKRSVMKNAKLKGKRSESTDASGPIQSTSKNYNVESEDDSAEYSSDGRMSPYQPGKHCDEHDEKYRPSTPVAASRSQLTIRSTQTTLEKWTTPKKGAGAVITDDMDVSADKGDTEASRPRYNLRNGKGSKSTRGDMGNGPATERISSKVKTRPKPRNETDCKSVVAHDNPRVQKQLDIAAEKMGKLTRLNGGSLETEKKKKKQKNENQQKKTAYGELDMRKEKKGTVTRATGSNSDETVLGCTSGDSRGFAGKGSDAASKDPSRSSAAEKKTDRSPSPMETDTETSDGESDNTNGSVLSVGKFSSDSDDVESTVDHATRPKSSNIAAWGQYSVGSSDAVEFERDSSMAIEEDESSDDTTEHSSEASVPEIGTDTQTETTAGDAKRKNAEMPTDDGSLQAMKTPSPADGAMTTARGQSRPEDKPLNYPPQVVFPNATSQSTKPVSFSPPVATDGMNEQDSLSSTKAQNSSIPAEALFEQYAVVAINFDAFPRNETTGYPMASLRKIVSRFYAIIFNGLNLLGAHAVGLPYDAEDGISPQLSCAADLPNDPQALLAYAKDARFNRATEKVVFHVRFLSSTPIAHLKRAYYPEIGDVGRTTMTLLQRHKVWYKTQQCSETRVAKLGWFLFSHPSDGIDNFRAQLRSFWKERNIIIDDNQWQVSARRFTVREGKKKIETTALWIDSGLSVTRQVCDACRLVTAKAVSHYPLLWNTMFISDRDFMELRADFRFASAERQKQFITSRFTHDIRGPAIDPYKPVLKAGKEPKQAPTPEKCLAQILLAHAKSTGRDGRPITLFTKLQLPAARPGIWSFQGSRETAGMARAWLDRKLKPLLSQLFGGVDKDGRPDSFHDVGRVQGKMIVNPNDPTESYLKQAKAAINPQSLTSQSSLVGQQQSKMMPSKKGMASYAEVLAANQRFPHLVPTQQQPPESINTTANLTGSISPISKGPSIDELQARIDQLVKTVETLTQQQRSTQAKYEAQRQADREEFKRHLETREKTPPETPMPFPTKPPKTWLEEIDAHIEAKIKEADRKLIDETKVITQQSQTAVIDFTSKKLLEMSTKIDAFTQQVTQLPSILQEMRNFMTAAAAPSSPAPGKRVRTNESFAPGSRVECQYSLDYSGTDTAVQIDSRTKPGSLHPTNTE